MADDDQESGQELTNAYRRRCISYPDYKPTMDFGIWMNGLREKIRYAFGFTHDQTDEVDAEIVRSISGRLQVGTALDAYHRRKRELLFDSTKAHGRIYRPSRKTTVSGGF